MTTKTNNKTKRVNFGAVIGRLVRSRLAAFMGFTHDGARDLYKAFGYSRMPQIEELYGLYLRNDIAHRIVRAFPQATWRDAPTIGDDDGDSVEKGDNYSAFAESVDDFMRRTGMWRTLERADRLASIGRFGVLYLGFADDANTDQPLKGPARFLFAQPYGELSVNVGKWCTDPKSERFGLPEIYNLNAAAGPDAEAKGAPLTSIRAHWTRCIHIAEVIDQDETYGVPRLLPIMNRLIDLEKVVGGGAEVFWITANRGMMLTTDPEASLDDDEIEAMKEQAEEFAHQLRRTIVGSGLQAQVLGADSPDPEPNSTILLDLIAGGVGIPKRILLGTERGELASGQDENNWSSRTDERRKSFAGPTILHPLLDILIMTGNVSRPRGHYEVVWPDIVTQDPLQEAQVISAKTTALATYANSPDAQLIVPPAEYRRDFLGIDPKSEYDIEQPYETLPDGMTDDPAALLPPGAEDGQDEGPEDINPDERSSRSHAERRTLYISRPVLNIQALQSWADSQGIPLLEDLHVTLIYSRKPVDWMDVSRAYGEDDDGGYMVHPGGPRVISRFGARGTIGKEGAAIVLEFNDSELKWRHEQLRAETGAAADHLEFRPHITLFYDDDGTFDEKTVEPYTGAIALGPEEFDEIDTGWKPQGLTEDQKEEEDA